MPSRIEWDEAKSAANKKKHGVSFREAQELFVSGVEYLELLDRAHSVDEDRYIAIGPVASGVLFVVFTERDEGDVVRIISARPADRREVALYRKYAKECP